MAKVETIEFIVEERSVRIQTRYIEKVVDYIPKHKGAPVRRIAWDTEVSAPIVNRILRLVPEAIELVKKGYVSRPERGSDPAWMKDLSETERATVVKLSSVYDTSKSLVANNDVLVPTSVRYNALQEDFSDIGKAVVDVAIRMGPRAGRKFLFGYKKNGRHVDGVMVKVRNLAETGQSAFDDVEEVRTQLRALTAEVQDMKRLMSAPQPQPQAA